jgi:hypothetical protein
MFSVLFTGFGARAKPLRSSEASAQLRSLRTAPTELKGEK